MRRRLSVALLAVVPVFGLAVLFAQDAAQKPSFRTAVALVPVDVSVVGRDGKPVQDLKKEDFTILEDGVPQEIEHFSLENLVAETTTTTTSGDTVIRRAVPVLELAPQQRRVFLVALTTWRGSRIQEPNKALDALTQFANKQLLPQDVIAVIAYNRATAFTTNHAAIAEVIERYRARSEKIASLLEQYFSGLQAIYGTGKVPDYIQREIDTIFDVPGATMRHMATMDRRPTRTAAVPPAGQIDVEKGGVAIPSTEREVSATGIAPDSPDEIGNAELQFNEFVAKNLQSMLGLSQVFAGIQYMRNIEGQKRLLYIGPGMFLPTTDDDHNIAAMANDARVAVDMIQAGGMQGLPMYKGAFSGPAGFNEIFNFMSLRNIAEQTGGQAFIAKYTKPALDLVDTVTRTQYLLGYYPRNTNWDGKYRHVVVKVNRPNVAVVWRQGYYGRQDRAPYNSREFLTFTRISAAAWSDVPVEDMKLKTDVRDDVVTVTIDVSKVAFRKEDDRQVAQLRIAVFYGDARGRRIDERWNTIDLRLTEESYRKSMAEGVEYRYPVPVDKKPRYMKIVVYNYDADVLGSVQRELR